MVALFTRAWIEIPLHSQQAQKIPVALFTRAWIEILLIHIIIGLAVGRPLHEGVD